MTDNSTNPPTADRLLQTLQTMATELSGLIENAAAADVADNWVARGHSLALAGDKATLIATLANALVRNRLAG